MKETGMYRRIRAKAEEIMAEQSEDFCLGLEPLEEPERDKLLTLIRKHGYIMTSYDEATQIAMFGTSV